MNSNHKSQVRNLLGSTIGHWMTIPPSPGVGVSLSDQVFLGSVPNNSAVIVNNESENDQELLCHSALQSSCSGEWSSLTLPALQNCTEGDEASGTSTSYESVRLHLGSPLDEGLYTCGIQDEVLQEQELYVGVYNSGKHSASPCWNDVNTDQCFLMQFLRCKWSPALK